MISLEIFLFGLMAVSTLTGLTTEAVKKILTERKVNYYANTLTGIVAVILSVIAGVCYFAATGTGFTAQAIVYIVAMTFASWLCAMVGYDKVVQIITQVKTSKKG